MSSKYNENKALFDHLSDFHGIIQQLSVMEIKFDDEVRELLLLSTLLDSWDTFRMTLCNGAPSGKVTLYFVKVGILNEEMRKKSHGVSSSQPEKAYVAENKGRSNSRASNARGFSKSKSCGKFKHMKCNYCDKMGQLLQVEKR